MIRLQPQDHRLLCSLRNKIANESLPKGIRKEAYESLKKIWSKIGRKYGIDTLKIKAITDDGVLEMLE